LNKKSIKAGKTLSKAPKGKLRENIEALVIAVILALFIRAFVVQAFKIPTGSMQNTLLVGDYILVNKFIYGVKIPFTQKTLIPIKDPKPGEIIVFKYPKDPSKDYIKRVVGVGGDTVEIRNKKVYVNGKLQNDEFTVHADPSIMPDTVPCRENVLTGMRSSGCRDNMSAFTVPEGKLFMMGDNRDQSNDSRFWGFVDISAVKGKAFMIYWSWDKARSIGVRWSRLGHMIH
jgi:signal peptidase I